MRGRIPKILMLGWEFPPVINGGLGVACHDLSVAMSSHADVTMIIPKSSPEFIMKNLNLIGLNTIEAGKIAELAAKYSGPLSSFGESSRSFPNIHFIPADLNPYYNEYLTEESKYSFTALKINQGDIRPFNIDDLYGGNVIEKVIHYSNLAAAMAMEMEFDVIHAHDWMTMLAGMKIKAQSGKPLVMHIHSLEVDRSGHSSGWVFEMEKKGMEYADLLLPVSNFTGNNIVNHYGIDKSKISTIHNGIGQVVPFKSERSYDEKTVLFIGRLTRQKGPEYFLEIASKVLEQYSDVRFVMAGSGDNFKYLIDQSSYQHIGNRFHLTGFLNLEQVRHLLSIADVYCMPSVSEPFGLSAVEAAQFGIPCVISKQSGVSEVLSGSLKFDFWDTDKAAEYIIKLLKDPVLKNKVVEDANENLRGISWDISASKVMKAYKSHQLTSKNNPKSLRTIKSKQISTN